MPDQAVERPVCKNFPNVLKCSRDLARKSDRFRSKKISQMSEYLNFMQTEHKIFFRPGLLITPFCARPMRKFSLTTNEKCAVEIKL